MIFYFFLNKGLNKLNIVKEFLLVLDKELNKYNGINRNHHIKKYKLKIFKNILLTFIFIYKK